MKVLGNIIWIIFGGFATALEYFMGGLTLCCTIIGIPFGFQLFKLGLLALLPFGKETRSSEGGCVTTLLNIIWLFTGGLVTALTHLFFGVLLAITIVGLPFAKQHFKLTKMALLPFGRTIFDPSEINAED
jgi:uncharacterized membrane protein YccF (DUF307 family)